MKKKLAFMILIILSIFVTGCSASEKRYEESMEAALAYIDAGDLENAQASLEIVLEEKPDAEDARAYYEQMEEILKAEKALAAGDLEKAEKHAAQVVKIEGGLVKLVNHAESIGTEVEAIAKKHEKYLTGIAEAEKLLTDKKFFDAMNILNQLTKEESTNVIFADELDKVTSLQTEVKEAEKAEKVRIQAEKEKREKEEQERLAKEKAEQARLVKEKEKAEAAKQQGVGPFKGYWLKDTMACHITDTYSACALAESDFMTNDKIIQSKLISDTEVELTFEGNEKVTLRLRDQNSLELADGIYKRVSAEEANAIYGGYYTLP